jgi:hypothetical protein|tara:strand:+ start:10073 stop:10219 length:147 start_codon:yes stop_codon:yes gene_type:complete
MTRYRFLILGIAMLCALPILGTLYESRTDNDRTVRLSVPQSTSLTYRY